MSQVILSGGVSVEFRSVLLLFLCLLSCSAQRRNGGSFDCNFDHGVDLETTRPLVIAHQGSSGAIPEHTVAGYQLAVAEGADVVECDATVTKDLTVICMHEAWMNASTNVAQTFPASRINTYYVQDEQKNITDYFSVDFTMDEIRLIRRRQRSPYRDPSYDDRFPVASLEDLIRVVQSADRPVGVYIETKSPVFTNSLSIVQNANVTFEGLILEIIQRFGYTSSRSPCFLQSFNEDSLLYFANRTSLPLTMLLRSSDDDISDARLDQIARFAYAIGPDKQLVIRTNSTNHVDLRTDLVQRAHAAGLRVHPFTLRNEYPYLAWDYRQDPVNEYADYFELGVDGAFTDFPATYSNFLNYTYCNAC